MAEACLASSLIEAAIAEDRIAPNAESVAEQDVSSFTKAGSHLGVIEDCTIFVIYVGRRCLSVWDGWCSKLVGNALKGLESGLQIFNDL